MSISSLSRAVVLLTTARKGSANVMTMSWHMMVEFEPPLVACVVSNADYSFSALRETKECIIAIPEVHLAQKIVDGPYNQAEVENAMTDCTRIGFNRADINCLRKGDELLVRKFQGLTELRTVERSPKYSGEPFGGTE